MDFNMTCSSTSSQLGMQGRCLFPHWGDSPYLFVPVTIATKTDSDEITKVDRYHQSRR